MFSRSAAPRLSIPLFQSRAQFRHFLPVGVFSYLGEANVVGLLTEALTADVEAVLADETSRVGADTAKQRRKNAQLAAILQFVRQKFECEAVFPCSVIFANFPILPPLSDFPNVRFGPSNNFAPKCSCHIPTSCTGVMYMCGLWIVE